MGMKSINGIYLMLIFNTCYTIDDSLRIKRQTIDDSTSYRRKGGPTGRKLELESRCKYFLLSLCIIIECHHVPMIALPLDVLLLIYVGTVPASAHCLECLMLHREYYHRRKIYF